MNAKKKYLQELEICFDNYLKSNSKRACKIVCSKIEGAYMIAGIRINEYGTHLEKHSINDFDTICANEIKQIEIVRNYYLQVIQSSDKDQLYIDFKNIRRFLYEEICDKSQYKFKNGKYLLLKPNGKYYHLFAYKMAETSSKQIKQEKLVEMEVFIKKFKEANKPCSSKLIHNFPPT